LRYPRYEIFNMIDDILFMGQNGRPVYLGSSSSCLDYFTSIGFPCPEMKSPADHFLDVMSGTVPHATKKDFTTGDLSDWWEKAQGGPGGGGGRPSSTKSNGSNSSNGSNGSNGSNVSGGNPMRLGEVPGGLGSLGRTVPPYVRERNARAVVGASPQPPSSTPAAPRPTSPFLCARPVPKAALMRKSTTPESLPPPPPPGKGGMVIMEMESLEETAAAGGGKMDQLKARAAEAKLEAMRWAKSRPAAWKDEAVFTAKAFTPGICDKYRKPPSNVYVQRASERKKGPGWLQRTSEVAPN
jgi:hypothetical protein